MSAKASSRVLLGMSGGVDSSVAAYLLQKDGYEVVGVTLRLWCDTEIADAKAVCENLDIEHHVVDLSDLFREKIVEPFICEYNSGRTPNPCISCNRHIKFGEMFRLADKFDCHFVATGHYAEKAYDSESGLYHLCVSENKAKDQSYVLYCLNQEKLARVLFPVAGYEKDFIRATAASLGLDVSEKKDSQDICFVPDKNYAAFVESHSHPSAPGDFVNQKGEVMGRHKGIIHYTIGQRKGLGLALSEPAFVVKIDAEHNQVILGTKGDEFSSSLNAVDTNKVMPLPQNTFECLARIRYSAKPVLATCTLTGPSSFHLEFKEPQRAITPGQSVVLYDLEFTHVLAGGIISASEDS